MNASLQLDELEKAVGRRLAGKDSQLEILGYGEIGCVLAWGGSNGRYACKRLPVFDSISRFDAYSSCFAAYLAELAHRDTLVLPSSLERLTTADSHVVVYCVQPVVPPELLAPEWLRRADRASGRWLAERVVERVAAVVGATVGLDAHLSNWAVLDGDVVYFDLTTPLLRDDRGREQLDTELFLASLPALIRPVVRSLFLPKILATYYEPRSVMLDAIGNLQREGLGAWVAEFVEVANAELELDLTVGEVDRYYRRDARLWSFLQRMRRVDRAWQLRVRRRPYPFLLPGRIERRL